MSLFTIALILVFITINAINYREDKNEMDHLLNDTIETMKRDNGFNGPKEGNPPLDRPVDRINDLPFLFTFGVVLDQNNNIINEYQTNNIDKEFLDNILKALKDKEEQSGKIEEYNIVYLSFVDETNQHKYIAFSVQDFLDNSYNNILLISSLSLISLWIIVFVIVLFLSKQIVKPVEEMLDKQKRFVQDASHDLKTPLTVILANSDILEKNKDDKIANQIEWIESTKDEAIRMKSLVLDMLESAQSESLADHIKLEETDLSELTEGIALQFETVAFEKNVGIVCAIEDDIKMSSNKDAYSRILHVLIDNAIKYSDDGGKVFINLSKNKHGVHLEIINHGEVIGEEAMKHMFERFYRADSTRSTEGFGLGLSIAKDLVEALNGKIICQSNEKDGTKFAVDFKR